MVRVTESTQEEQSEYATACESQRDVRMEDEE